MAVFNDNSRSRDVGATKPPRGLTLLETLLAIALAAVALAMLATAIHLNLKMLESRRGYTEQAQLARSVLRMMADDIRGAHWTHGTDVSGVAELLEGAMPIDGESLGELTGDPSSDETAGGEIAETAEPPTSPGLYGNRYELQVDVSRLPRVDQWLATTVDGARADEDVLGDVKTVAYFLDDGNSTSSITAAAPIQSDALNADSLDPDLSGGLIRRVLDRATASWAQENGNSDLLARGTAVIAPEVVGLEFAYYDGVEWVEYWDSAERGGLPLAVAIAMAVSSTPNRERDDRTVRTDVSSVDANDRSVCVYRLVVDLPMADLKQLEAAAAGSDEEKEEEEEEKEEDAGDETDDEAGQDDGGGSDGGGGPGAGGNIPGGIGGGSR